MRTPPDPPLPTPPAALDRADWLIATALFVGLSVVYFLTLAGITSSNDGSHYALLRTMVANRAFTLNQFDDFAEGNDIAITPDGRLFSDRPPGTAVAGVPFYWLGGLLTQDPLPNPLPGGEGAMPSRHDAANPRLPYVLLLPVLAGAGTAALLYALLRYLDVGRAAALTAVIFFALGTTQWKYSTVLFSHALSGFLIVLSVTLALLLAERELAGWSWYALLGFALGAAVVVEYSNALLLPIVGLFWLWRSWPRAARRPLTTVLPALAAAAVPLAFLAWYNTVNFGRPWTLSYTYAVNYPWAGAFATTFSFPLLAGLRALLWWGEGGGWCGGPPCLNQGLLLLSPLWVLALPGLVVFLRRRQAAFGLMTGLFLVYLLLFAKHHTSHGFTADGRYLVPFLGLLVPALGFALDWLFDPRRGAIFRTVAALVVYGLFFLSLGRQMAHIGTSYGYTLDLAALQLPLARPENVGLVLRAVFPNAANWAQLLLPLAAAVALAALARRRLARR
ncbi:MAG: phospholipid carrier-dependent glycosyltransferase [Candidatus Promineofilum sp.]|nr:phospholipid carrier-dependent glycosyltransferase [Promineifilum sp.]